MPRLNEERDLEMDVADWIILICGVCSIYWYGFWSSLIVTFIVYIVVDQIKYWRQYERRE